MANSKQPQYGIAPMIHQHHIAVIDCKPKIVLYPNMNSEIEYCGYYDYPQHSQHSHRARGQSSTMIDWYGFDSGHSTAIYENIHILRIWIWRRAREKKVPAHICAAFLFNVHLVHIKYVRVRTIIKIQIINNISRYAVVPLLCKQHQSKCQVIAIYTLILWQE